MSFSVRTTARDASAHRAPARRFALAAFAASIAFLAAVPAQAPRAAVRNPEDLLIVDCLLPGQVRKLGRVSQFMTARRPIRTTQADCEIRGGEFVSYDRANYQTALQVWLGQAQSGDAEAQNYVGEIYAKGLGTPPDYAKAFEWFSKSAATGNKRAKINLGYLYENGLGTEKDLAKALNLYREASGATDELLFASTVTAQAEAAQAQIESLQQTVARKEQEAAALRAQNEQLKGELANRKRALQQSSQELQRARTKLIEQQTALATPQDAEQLRVAQAKLDAQQKQLAAERAQLDADRAAQQAKLNADRAKLADLKARESKLAAAPASDPAAKKELDRVRAAAAEMALALDGVYSQMEALQSQVAANDARLAAEQAKFDAERKAMQAQLAGSQQDRELLLLLEQQLAEKQREVGKQREQITSLERQMTSATPGPESLASLSGSPGPLVEIIEPALTVTRGKPAAMVRGQVQTSDVVGKVVAKGGLSTVVVNGQTVTVGANGLFKVAVPVTAEGSSVQVAATDKAGTRTALEFVLLPAPTSGKGGASTATSAVAARPVPRGVELGRYHALVIGNNAYTGGYGQLASAVSDAEKVSGVLSRKYGFNVRTVRNGTRMEILTALNELREQLKPEDNLLVYFAGHGELDGASQQGYWIPVDARQGDPSTWISNRAVSDILNTIAAKHVLVVADSCYSGAMTRASVPAFNAAIGDDKYAEWVKTMAASRSRTALTSGGLAPVPDSSAGGNSLFARALVSALEDNSQLMEGQKLFREVTASLAAAATESALLQFPEYAPIQFAGHEAGEFFFRPKA
jgi:hypothetical protein